jgi:Flp pilus assembly protein TadB
MVNQACRVDSDIPDFIDVVSVHLRSGKPPVLAFLTAAENAPGEFGHISRRVVDDVHTGSRFVDALTKHRHSFGLRAQALIDGLIDTERDGLPPRQLFERLATDAHTQRRREADARIRALPVRLTMPLVGCILPAYVMLAVVPLLVSQFSSVHLDPQT